MLEVATMLAKDSVEGQRYVLPARIGVNVVGIHSGWNYNKQYILFLLEHGERRVMRCIMPEEVLEEVRGEIFGEGQW